MPISSFSSNPSFHSALDPNFVTVYPCKTHTVGWCASLTYTITAADSTANKALFHDLEAFFGVSNVISYNRGNLVFRIYKLKDLQRVRKHFESYP
jgi:hypothetical protein